MTALLLLAAAVALALAGVIGLMTALSRQTDRLP